jgi:hypothetical protein
VVSFTVLKSLGRDCGCLYSELDYGLPTFLTAIFLGFTQSDEELCFLHGEGPRSRCCGRTTALRLFVQPYDEDEDEQFFLPSFTSNGAPVELN